MPSVIDKQPEARPGPRRRGSCLTVTVALILATMGLDGCANNPAARPSLAPIGGVPPAVGPRPWDILVLPWVAFPHVAKGPNPLRQASLAEILSRRATRSATPGRATVGAPAVLTNAPHAKPPAIRKVGVAEKLQSERWYVRGRESLEKNQTQQAIVCFGKSLRLNPNAFTVMRLLAQTYLTTHDAARARQLLRRAAAVRPHSLRVRYLLGRLDIFQRRWPAAVRQLGAVSQFDQLAKSPLRPLIHFYLATALTEMNAPLAAARQYEQFLHDVALPLVFYQHSGEIGVLRRHAWEIKLAAAENYLHAGRARRALYWFRQARRQLAGNVFVTGRIAALLSRLGHGRAARRMALHLVRQTAAAPGSLRLLIWMYPGAGASGALGDALQRATEHGPEKAAAWLAAGRLLQLSSAKVPAMKAFAASFYKQPRQERALKKFALLARLQHRTGYALAALMFGVACDVQHLPVNHVLRVLTAGTPKNILLKQILRVRPRQKLPGQVSAAIHANAGSYAGPRYFLAALAGAHAGRPRVANGYFNAALRHMRPSWNLYRGFAQELLNARQFRAADNLLQSAAAVRTGAARDREMRINSLILQQRLPKALALAQRFGHAWPATPAFETMVVKILLMQGRPHAAVGVLRQTLDRFGHYRPAYRQMLGVAGELHDPALEKRTLAKLTTVFPKAWIGRWARAVLEFQRNRLMRAARAFQTLVLQRPGRIGNAIWLGQIELAAGRRAEAFKLLKSELTRYPASVRVAAALAQMLQTNGHGRLAITVLKKIAMENPASGRHWKLLAAFLTRRGRHAQAAAALHRGILTAAGPVGLHRSLAAIQARHGAYAQAATTLAAGMRQYGATPGRLYALGHLQSQDQRPQEAINTLVQAHSALPWAYRTNNLLARLLATKGRRLRLAARLVNRALQCQPNNPRFLDTKGWILYKQRHLSAAVAWFRRALNQPGRGHVPAAVHLGDALYRLGRFTKALEHWRVAAHILAAHKNLDPAGLALRRRLALEIQQAVQHKAVRVAPVAKR